MTNPFPVGIFIWLLIWLYREVKKEDPEEIKHIPEIEMHPMWKVRCFSNGRLLPNKHLIYYCDTLDLPGDILITDESIERAASFRQSLIGKIDAEETQPLSIKDIATAKAYLIDRWMYMTSVN